MKKVTIDSLRKISSGGAKVVDKDGLEVRFPQPKVDEKKPAPPIPVERPSQTQPIVDSLDKLAGILSKVLRSSQTTADSVSAALSSMADAKSPPHPKRFEVSLSRGKDGKIESMMVTPKF